MDFINDMNATETLFDGSETISKIGNIVAEIIKYDVYDILAKILGLNLIPQNQNKSILLDGLIAAILSKNEEDYRLNHKISPGKFRRLIELSCFQ